MCGLKGSGALRSHERRVGATCVVVRWPSRHSAQTCGERTRPVRPILRLMRVTKNAFFDSLRRGDLNSVRRMVSEKPTLANEAVRSGAFRGFSALCVALRLKEWDMARVLVGAGADVNFVPDSKLREMVREWYPPLHWALFELMDVTKPGRHIEQKGCDFVGDLINRWGADVHLENHRGSSSLQVANSLLGRHHPQAVEYYMWALELVFGWLLAAGADPHRRGSSGSSPAENTSESSLARRLMRLD